MRVRVEDEKNNSNIVEELKKTTEVNRNNIYIDVYYGFTQFLYLLLTSGFLKTQSKDTIVLKH